MKTKEEVIREAWGLLWDNFNKTSKECALKNDGYVSTILENNLYQTYTYYNKVKAAWRPKSLEVIENNNGWIRIKSKEDLPKDGNFFWVIKKGYDYPLFENMYHDDGDYWVKWFTHYKKIDTPKKPHY